jgi:hypothetical protein
MNTILPITARLPAIPARAAAKRFFDDMDIFTFVGSIREECV